MGKYEWRVVRHNVNGYKAMTWAGPGWYVVKYNAGGFDCWPAALSTGVGMRTYLESPKLLTPTANELARARTRVSPGRCARRYVGAEAVAA